MIQPHFSVNIIPQYSLTNNESFGTTALISDASYGVADSVGSYTSIVDVVKEFKEGNIVDAAKIFFANGGSNLKIYRIQKSALQASSPTAITQFALTSIYKGSYANNIILSVDYITSSSLTATLSLDNYTENYTATTTSDLISQINANSSLVTGTYSAELTADISATNLIGGSDGSTVTDDEVLAAIETLVTVDYDYIVIPNFNTPSIANTLASYLSNRARDENKYSTFFTGCTLFEEVDTSISTWSSFSDDNGAVAVVHTSMIDSDGTQRDGSWSAVALAGRQCSIAVQDSLTYKTLSSSFYKDEDGNEYTSAEREALLNAGIIPIGVLMNDTKGVVEAVTKNDITNWNYPLSEKIKVDYICANVFENCKGYIGNPNDSISRNAILGTVNSFLRTCKSSRIIDNFAAKVSQGSDPREVLIDVSIKLIYEINYITFSLVLTL